MFEHHGECPESWILSGGPPTRAPAGYVLTLSDKARRLPAVDPSFDRPACHARRKKRLPTDRDKVLVDELVDLSLSCQRIAAFFIQKAM
jgi:hypothetical protein